MSLQHQGLYAQAHLLKTFSVLSAYSPAQAYYSSDYPQLTTAATKIGKVLSRKDVGAVNKRHECTQMTTTHGSTKSSTKTT